MTIQWLTELRGSPTKAVSDALAGLADFGRYQRADTDDAIVTILNGINEPKPYQESLALGIWDWLEGRRRFSATQREAYGLDPFVREVREALIIAQRLDLTLVTRNILRDFWSWENWSQKLLLRHASRDVRLQLLKLCAVHQQALDDNSLEPRWIHYCRDAGTAVPLSYLDVALLGLRTLPREPAEDLAVRAAFGLGLWAATYHPAKNEFIEHWSSLRHLMPRSDPMWRSIVETAIENVCRFTSMRDPESPSPRESERPQTFWAAAWMREKLKAAKRTDASRSRREAGASEFKSALFPPPNSQEAHDLAKFAQDDFSDKVLENARELFDRHEQWVQHYGNSYYYQQALAIITPAFIKVRSRRATDLIVYYVRRALMWDEKHDTLWNLWQRCLSRLGQHELAENIAWEAVRRFPENVETRVQLAQLLVKSGRNREAESLLSEVFHLAGRRPAFYLVLCKILSADKTRRGEAYRIMSTAIDKNPNNHNLLVFAARLQLSRGQNQKASELLDQAEAAGDSPHYYAVRFRWAFREMGLDEAGRWLDLGLRIYPRDTELLEKRKYLEGGTADSMEEIDLMSELGVESSPDAGATSAPETGDSTTASSNEAREATPPDNAETGPAETAGHPPVDRDGASGSPTEGPRQAEASPIAGTGSPPAAKPASQAAAAPQPAVVSGDKQPVRSESPPKPEPDNALEEIVRHGRAKRADFALNGAGLQGPARRAAQADLENLVKKYPEFLYGQVVRHRRVQSSDASSLSQKNVSTAIEIGVAFEAGNAILLRKITKAGDESLLADLATALAGDQDAGERWKKGVPKVLMQAGYASQVLQKLINDLGTTDVPRESRDEFRVVWTEPVKDISSLEHYFFQAIDASLLFSVADNSIRLGS